MKDPMEEMLEQAFKRNKVVFETERGPNSRGLDYYLPDYKIHIEVKQFHSPRIAEQMSRTENVIAIQGEGAVRAFCRILDLRSRC